MVDVVVNNAIVVLLSINVPVFINVDKKVDEVYVVVGFAVVTGSPVNFSVALIIVVLSVALEVKYVDACVATVEIINVAAFDNVDSKVDLLVVVI